MSIWMGLAMVLADTCDSLSSSPQTTYAVIGPEGIVIGEGMSLEQRGAEIPARFLMTPPMIRVVGQVAREFITIPVTDTIVTSNMNLAIEAVENRSYREQSPCNRQLQLGTIIYAERENGEYGRSVYVEFTVQPLAAIAAQCKFDVNALPTCRAIVFLPYPPPKTNDSPGVDFNECHFFDFRKN